MEILLAGPIQTGPLRDWLTDELPANSPTGRGGTAVTQIAIGLLERGHRVTVVTLDTAIEPGQEFRAEGQRLTLHVGPYRTKGRARDAFSVERRYVAETIDRVTADVVHAHWTYEYALGALAVQRGTLITVRDWAPTILAHHPDHYRLVRLGMNVVALYRGAHFTVTSPYMRDRVERWRRVRPDVIPNALHDRAFAVRPRTPNGAPVILAVNNGAGRRKNVPTLLRAFSIVIRRLPLARLRLAGAGYEADGPISRWARMNRLDQGVEFYGFVPHDELVSLYDSATLFAHPALEESFGIVLVEAMARGVPVVAGARSGAVPWVLGHGDAGVLTDVTSPPALAAAIHEVANESEWANRVGLAGYDYARRMFSLSSVIDSYVDVYTRLSETAAGASR